MIKNRFLPIVILCLLAVFFIFFQFDQIPRGLAHDENELARVAFSLENKPYTVFTPVADGHGTPYFYTLLASFKVFGVNPFALRLPSRIFSILSVLLLYLISQEIWGKKQLPISATVFSLGLSFAFLTSRWFLHFARVSFEMPFLLFLELVSTYCTILFLRTTQNKFLIIAGIMAGIAFNSYQPGRIFFLVPLCVFLIHRVNLRRIALYFLVPFLLFILPMSLYLWQHPGNDIRINEQFFLKNSSLTFPQKIQYLASNIQQTTLMFATAGDMNGQHNYTAKPALNPIMFGFFLLGLIVACRNLQSSFNLFFLIYFLIALFPTILTYPWENPNMLRTYTTLPSVIYFIGLGILSLYVFMKKRIRISWIITSVMAMLIILSVVYELRTYFIYQPLVFKQAFDVPDYLSIIRQNALKDR